VLLPENATNL